MNGQVLGDRYEIQQQLGRNAGRQTFVARDLKTNELVVVKLLSFGSGFEWDDLKLFEREAETLKALSHPAIPSYRDFFELNSPNSIGFVLVQTYLVGKSLEEHLKAGRTFSEWEVKQLAKNLLEILIYLHGRQPPVIHRDIKPSNILLTNRSGNSAGRRSPAVVRRELRRLRQVYLVDFGSVQTLTTKIGGTMTVVGTYGYMPPEQFGEHTVPASDLYSLGATLITLVTGTHPADLPQKGGRMQFEAKNISSALSSWLKLMTEPSLDRRLASASEALQALEQQQSRDGVWLFFNKPTGSKVSLTKDINSLEIIIPSTGFNLDVVVFALVWNSFLLLWTAGILSGGLSLIGLIFALFPLPLWRIGIDMILAICFSLFGQTRLCLNHQQISLTYELFGFKYNCPRPASRQDISKLEYTKTSFTRDSEGGLVEVKPQINVWAGVRKYELGSGGFLSEPELDWLAHELSDWLGLPITRK